MCIHFAPALYVVFCHAITDNNTDTETISAFVFIDSLAVSTFGLPYLLIELFCIGLPVVRTDGGRTGGRTVT